MYNMGKVTYRKIIQFFYFLPWNTTGYIVHGPDRVTVHPPPPPPGQSETKFFFAPWTSPDIKSRCHQKKVGMDYLFWAIFKMAAIKIQKSHFVP